jgi:hypothetical protein
LAFAYVRRHTKAEIPLVEDNIKEEEEPEQDNDSEDKNEGEED